MIISKIGCCALALLHLASAASLLDHGGIGSGGAGDHGGIGGGGGGAGLVSYNSNNNNKDDPQHHPRALQRTPTTRKPTTSKPTRIPTNVPSTRPPTGVPSTRTPSTRTPTTSKPTEIPSNQPTAFPTNVPTSKPTATPSNKPTAFPSNVPSTRIPTTSKPTEIPSNKPTTSKPTTAPTTSKPTTAAPTTATPTDQPTRNPTNSPVLPYDNPVLSCPPPGATMIVITPGVKTIGVAAADTFCGVFLRKGSESGDLIPLARSYHGKDWEQAPGPLACPNENVNGTTVVLPELSDPNDRYVILAKDGSLSERNQIARFLEMTTFGPKRSEIDAMAADGTWATTAAAKRAAHIRSQIDSPKTSHREYFRKRANTKWDSTAQTARSDHPCSPNSKWRKYSYIQQDRLHTLTEALIVTTFETVQAEENLTTTIYEADSAAQVSTPTGFSGAFWFPGATTSTYTGYSGTGFYDMGGTNDYVQFTVNVPSDGPRPISFRFSQGSTSYNGNRKMQLQVNGVIVRNSYDFFYTGSSSYWKYSEMIYLDLNAGANTIKLLVVEQNGGPNIDHLRIGKPPAIVMKSNGWPRVIARNGLHLLDAWPFNFTNTTQVTFKTNNPDAPQAGLFRYPYGRLRVLLPNGKENFLDIGNPPINFTDYEQYLPSNVFMFDGSETWDETASDLFNYPMMRGRELLLRNGFNGPICDLVPPFAEEYDAPIFGKLSSGEWVQWTPKILLENNGPSINDPPGNRTAKVLVDGGGENFVSTDEKLKCSNVQRSFVNEDTCFLSTLSTACSATNPVGEVMMTMNTTLVLDLFNLTGREVYAITGLVMESRTESPCAKTRSRWVAERGATCTAPSVLGNLTIAALTNAIIASTNKNDFVTDVDRTSLCNAADWDQDSDPIHIQLQVGPDCYTHVHPDHLNVYDFTGWVTNHPGGPYHIQKWSQGWEGHPGWYLNFPFYGNATRKIPAHPMNRWVSKVGEPNIVKVGRLGDTIAYRDLISELKTDAVAEHFGATPKTVADGGLVVCGSPGEVSNDPSLPETFDVRSDEYTVSSEDTMNNQKHVVWTEVALYAIDQLRQRMAWALSQIITTVPNNINAYMHTEIYTNYYDIFVKHAFGNFRDILKATSYSPLMAEHLSYLKSKSHSYVYEFENKRIARADENFAREVMQLFSIGLSKLNDDGTPVLDPVTGYPLETYTNEDIESLARAWTGFDRISVRGNYEDSFRGNNDNRMDPMQIVAEYRDPFPKSNLDKGFVGDGYLLCTDLPAQSFLKRGAVYRLLGGKSSPELMKDPSYFATTTPGEILRAEIFPSSQLYQTLYNSNYKASVKLENDLTCTAGTFECRVDTLRIVKVGSMYYEFVERPCVQLAFYNNGKQIQLRDNWRRGQMCANSDLAHAREACCREDRVDEVNGAVMVSNVTYFYEGERMKYDTARDRCVAYGRDLCLYDWLESKPIDKAEKKGYHWTNKDCAVNVKVNSEGYIAIVHDAISTQEDTIPWLVEEKNTLNWFRVFWEGSGDYPGSNETNTCEANKCKVVVSYDGSSSCLCKAIVTDSMVFTNTNVSKEDVMLQLFIGALGPQAGSEPTSLGTELIAHIVGGIINEMTIFEVHDKGRTIYLKNTRSTVSLEGWTVVPQVYEAEDAIISNAIVKNDTISATGRKYVEARYGNETTYLQWNVNVPSPGTYSISLRYAHDSSPRPLTVYVNAQEVVRQLVNPNSVVSFVNVASDPNSTQLPLQRCGGDCDVNTHCMPGLFCQQNNGLERVPGCNGAQNSWDYCVDIDDFDYGFTLAPTGSWTDDWHMSKPLQVNLNAGQNTIRVQLPPRYKEGPNIDHLKVEGLPVSSTLSSFRNPPHFMSLIPDYSNGRIGERNLRDAQYETDAVLDHYFFQDNVAPFLCVRVMQRFSFSNPSRKFVSSCVRAFRTGFYTSGLTTFGNGQYGSLEAMVASILLDSEATEGAVSVDPTYGSIREPILKLMHLMRSMEYQTDLPTPTEGSLIQRSYNVKIWKIDEKIGQGPYEFPSVFSFFLSNYIPQEGPNQRARLTSPESVLVTMPNIVGLLNGMFSLIKYGLSDCNGGFSLYTGYGPNPCMDNGLYQRSFGHLFYELTGVNDNERAEDLSQLLTAGRLCQNNLDKIVAACSTEPDQGSKNRCMTQLVVTTAEFQTTGAVTLSGQGREVVNTTSVNSTEPYKAIVYFFLSGGLDSYHMLAPHTCAPIDVYERYRTIRGKSDSTAGVGLTLERLLQIPANNAAQPCSTFGINHNLTALKTLYDEGHLNFITNAGLLARPVTVTNYNQDTPVELFAHDAMIQEAFREDIYDVFSGTGVGGRMAEVLIDNGIPTDLFSIQGQVGVLTGAAGEAPTQTVLTGSGLATFNADPSITNMNDHIKSLNNDNTADSGFHAETWSSKLTESMNRHQSLKEKVDNTTVTTVFPLEGLSDQFKLVTRLMQTRVSRGSKRDIFFVQDGGYDTHDNVDASLIINFGRINGAIQAFVNELKILNLWESTTVVQFSEFARTLNPNTGDGSDHGWGGHHFMFGGAVKGGKVLGKYPTVFNEGEGSNYALSRGRMIPEYPWDAMWHGTAEWFGIPANSPSMDKVLPMHRNFPATSLYNKAELFNEISPMQTSEQSAPILSEQTSEQSAPILSEEMSEQSAPTLSEFGVKTPELVINTAMRCGTSEVDAREHCRSTCTTSLGCPSTMECFSVHVNFCDSIPQRIYVNPEVSVEVHRCGTSEIHSRTFCGAPCAWSADCTGGETCHGVHANYCGSLYNEV